MKQFLLGILTASAIWAAVWFSFPRVDIKPIPYAKWQTDTITVPGHTIYVTDKVSKAKLVIAEQKYQDLFDSLPDLEALHKEASDYWEDYFKKHPEKITGVYAAQSDSMFITEDSSALFIASFISPIPLHPKSYFVFQAELKQPPTTIITNTVYVERPYKWYDGFGVVAGVGAVYSRKYNDVTLGGFAGVGYRYNF